MSTKKNIVTIEVNKLESLKKRIEVMEVFESIIEETKENKDYYAKNAIAYAEQSLETYAEKELEKAKSFEYVIAILEQIASEI